MAGITVTMVSWRIAEFRRLHRIQSEPDVVLDRLYSYLNGPAMMPTQCHAYTPHFGRGIACRSSFNDQCPYSARSGLGRGGIFVDLAQTQHLLMRAIVLPYEHKLWTGMSAQSRSDVARKTMAMNPP